MREPTRLRMAARATAAIFGAYGLAWGLAAFGAPLGVWSGLSPADAVMLASLIGLLVLPLASLWAFAVPRAAVGWLALGGGGAALTLLGGVMRTAGP